MTKKRLWVIAGALGVSSIAAIPAITAQAYPPGKHLTVTVTQTGDHTYVINAINADPKCTFRVVSGNVKVNTPVNPDGTSTVTVDIGAKTGTRVILAKTIADGGTCKHKETTTTKVVTKTYTLRTDKGSGHVSATNGEKITIKALGWDPTSKVHIAIVDAKGHVVRSTSQRPNSSGNVFWKLTTPHSGTYAVIATQGTKSAHFDLTITPRKKH